MTMDCHLSSPAPRLSCHSLLLWLAAGMLVPVMSGCQTMDRLRGKNNPYVRIEEEDPLPVKENYPSDAAYREALDSYNRREQVRREAQRKDWADTYAKQTKKRGNSPVSQEQQISLKEAHAKLEAKQYKEAWKMVKPYTSKRKYKYDGVREEALFIAAQSHYGMNDYAECEEYYSALLKDFPTTRYTDESAKQLFHIARYWLNETQMADVGEIKQVDYDRPNTTPPPPDPTAKEAPLGYNYPLLPNFTDETRPMFDTPGRAIEALKNIWMRDPTGPLADDAIMLAGTYYLRNGNYVEADRHFNILRTEYPKSEHLEQSFVLGSYVKLMSYQGAEYEGKSLHEAEQLNKSTVKLFPENPDTDRLLEAQKEMELQKARREWERIEFYQRKGRDEAVAINCLLLIENYPNTGYAQQARKVLAELPPEALRSIGAVPPAPYTKTAPGEPRRIRDFFRREPKPIPTEPEAEMPSVEERELRESEDSEDNSGRVPL